MSGSTMKAVEPGKAMATGPVGAQSLTVESPYVSKRASLIHKLLLVLNFFRNRLVVWQFTDGLFQQIQASFFVLFRIQVSK